MSKTEALEAVRAAASHYVDDVQAQDEAAIVRSKADAWERAHGWSNPEGWALFGALGELRKAADEPIVGDPGRRVLEAITAIG